MLEPGRKFSGKNLEKLAGHFVAVLMLRRDLLCLLHATYQFIRDIGLGCAPLWKSVQRELLMTRALLPTIFAQSALPWLPIVSAYDASEWGLGVVESDWGSEGVWFAMLAFRSYQSH